MPGAIINCPQCRQQLQLPDGFSGPQVLCPTCNATIDVPAAAPAPGANVAGRCAYCQTAIKDDEPRTACPECKAEYHTDCWNENGGCAMYGCAAVPVIEPRSSLEIPVSYWGQEKKPCPACGREILAAAVRCRHCGATFASAQPENTDAFRQRTELEQRLPQLQKMAVWIFVVCVLPCTAPVGAVWGLFWYTKNRHEISALPALYPALCKIGLVVAIGQTVIFVAVAMLHMLFGHG